MDAALLTSKRHTPRRIASGCFFCWYIHRARCRSGASEVVLGREAVRSNLGLSRTSLSRVWSSGWGAALNCNYGACLGPVGCEEGSTLQVKKRGWARPSARCKSAGRRCGLCGRLGFSPPLPARHHRPPPLVLPGPPLALDPGDHHRVSSDCKHFRSPADQQRCPIPTRQPTPGCGTRRPPDARASCQPARHQSGQPKRSARQTGGPSRNFEGKSS